MSVGAQKKRSGDDKFRSPPNDRRCELAVIGIWAAMDACQVLLDGHAEDNGGEPCECGFCEDARGAMFNLDVVDSRMNSDLLPFPERVARYLTQEEASGDRDANAANAAESKLKPWFNFNLTINRR